MPYLYTWHSGDLLKEFEADNLPKIVKNCSYITFCCAGPVDKTQQKAVQS